MMAAVIAAGNKTNGRRKVGEKDMPVELHEVNCKDCYSLFWRAKIITVEPITFLFMLGTYFSVASGFQYYFQRYARDRLRSANHTMEHHFCITNDYLNSTIGQEAVDVAEEHATHLTFLSTLSSLLISVVSTVFIGPLTDRFGRKFAIVSANFGSMLSSACTILIVYKDLNLYYFLVANIVSSFFGGFGVLLMGTFSYIADISSHQIRSLRIGILDVMVYISSAISTLLVGVWLSEVNCSFTSLTWPPLICYLINLLYTLLVIPESLSKAQREAKRAEARKTGVSKLKVLWKGILLYFRPKLVTFKLWICLLVLLIVVVNITGAIIINTYFYIRKPLGWNPEQIGVYGGYIGVTHSLYLLLLMPLAFVIGIPDVVLAIIGVLASCLANLLIAGVRETWQMYAATSFQGIQAVIIPSVRSMMSKYVSKDEQGALFAVVAAVEISAALIGSSVYANVYPSLHQTSYFIMSVLGMVPIIPLCIVLVMEIWAKRANRKVEKQQLCNSVSGTTDDYSEQSSLLAN